MISLKKFKAEKIKLIIISNRKLCKDENLKGQVKKIFSDYEYIKNIRTCHLNFQNSTKAAATILTISKQKQFTKRLVNQIKSYIKHVNLKDKYNFMTGKKILNKFEIVNLTLRENDLNKKDYINLLKEIYPICKKYNLELNIHEKWDNFLDNKYKINGVHLKFKTFENINGSLDKRENLFKKYKNIGVSVHNLEEAKRAENLGATYLIAGHIFATTCKKNLEPKGLEFLKKITSSVNIPVFAIGGINEKNSDLILENNAYGVCIMSTLMEY